VIFRRPRGGTALPEEWVRAAELQSKLVAAGLPRATVTAVATCPGQPSDLRIERVPVAELGRLRRTLYKKINLLTNGSARNGS